MVAVDSDYTSSSCRISNARLAPNSIHNMAIRHSFDCLYKKHQERRTEKESRGGLYQINHRLSMRNLEPVLSLTALILLSASTLIYIEPTPEPPKSCFGYTVLECGKAINACGDTIPIKKFGESYKEYEEQQRKLQSK